MSDHSDYDYDVALSFAGEDRDIAASLAHSLSRMGHGSSMTRTRKQYFGEKISTTIYRRYIETELDSV